MAEHTKGELRLGQYWQIHSADGDLLLLGGVRTPMVGGPEMEEAKENARRLVSCWNACTGISTDDLERYGVIGRIRLAGRNAGD